MCLSLFDRDGILSQKLSSGFHLKSHWSEVGHMARFPEPEGGLQLGGKKG